MNKATFYKIMFTLAVFSTSIFIFALYRLDPRAGAVNIAIFLASLFIAIMSLVSLVLFSITQKVKNNEMLHATIAASIRRGVLIGLYAAAVLALSAIQLLTWWDALLLAFSLILFELYFISGKERVS